MFHYSDEKETKWGCCQKQALSHTHTYPLNCLCELTCLTHLLLSSSQPVICCWMVKSCFPKGRWGRVGYNKTEKGKYREKAEGGKTERTERKTSFVAFANFSNYSCHD